METFYKESLETMESQYIIQREFKCFEQTAENQIQDCQMEKDEFLAMIDMQSKKYLQSIELILQKKSIKNVPVEEHFNRVMLAMNRKEDKQYENLFESQQIDKEELERKKIKTQECLLQKKCPELMPLIDLLCRVWLNQGINIDCLRQLTPVLQQAFQVFVQKKFRAKLGESYIHEFDLTSEHFKLRTNKRHEEQYKFISKRYLKYLKQDRKLHLNFLIENFRICFENKFTNQNFDEFFVCDQKKNQFILKKSNKFFFQIVFDHPIFKDYFLQFKKKFIKQYREEIREKICKILMNVACRKNTQEVNEKHFKKVLKANSLKLPWSFIEIENAFQFIYKCFEQQLHF